LTGVEKGRKQNRAARFIDEPPLPGLDGDDEMAAMFCEWGFVKPSGFGLAPLDWHDLRAFSEMMGYDFTPWQAETLVAMSRDYAQIANSDEPLPMPYERDTIDRDGVADRLRNAFKSLAKKRGRNG
jgi:hypothetical protein